jgi:2-methylcitrate dehydratase
VEILLEDGSTIEDQMAVANAHPLGVRPFSRPDYIRKFTTLTEGIISAEESRRFLDAAQHLPNLPAEDLHQLNIALPEKTLAGGRPGIFL